MPGKPDRINVCYKSECQEQEEQERPEPDLLGGNMIWHHKTAPELVIKPLGSAQAFAKVQRRFGAGVLSSITCGKEMAYAQLTGNTDSFGKPTDSSAKSGTGAERGAMYYSNLGEKRSVKL